MPDSLRQAQAAAGLHAPMTVLYVEDDAKVRLGSAQALQLGGHEVLAFASAEQALVHLTTEDANVRAAGVLLSDVKLPGIDGLHLMARVLLLDPELPVILVTGHGDIAMAVQAMRGGAYDFIEKPYSSEQLNEAVHRALEKRRLSLEVNALRGTLQNLQAIDAKLMGRSAAMVQLRKQVLAVAGTQADVIISGETGTGKELVARCLHDFGRHADKPFAALNCGGMPENLFESDVFGHEAGAFTGAIKRRIGKIEHADDGTLFLDEIESMPMNLQVKMLRALQERQFERLGSNDLLPMRCRVIAATKSNLLDPPKDQPFRRDLYYRLSVVVLQVPPLRERPEDIPLLLAHFMAQGALRYELPLPVLSPERLHQLMTLPWPGNVRELRNAADRLVLGLPLDHEVEPADAMPLNLDEQLARFERQLIDEALRASDARVALAAERLGVPKKTLYDKMKRLNMALSAYKVE